MIDSGVFARSSLSRGQDSEEFEFSGTNGRGRYVVISVKVLECIAGIAIMVLAAAGCSPQEGQPATGSAPPATTAPTDYRSLPLEQRPEVFNPCEEITIPYLEAAGFEDVEEKDYLESHSSDSRAHMCGWTAYPMSLTVVGSWTSFDDIRARSDHAVIEETTVGNYDAIVYAVGAFDKKRECNLAMETTHGQISMGGSRNSRPDEPVNSDMDLCAFLLGFARTLTDDI